MRLREIYRGGIPTAIARYAAPTMAFPCHVPPPFHHTLPHKFLNPAKPTPKPYLLAQKHL